MTNGDEKCDIFLVDGVEGLLYAVMQFGDAFVMSWGE